VRYRSCAAETWAAVLDEPADLVAVAGGDGTVGRVAKKLVGRDIPIAPLPLGTANNISRTLGLADVPLANIIASWADARRVRFDVQGPWGLRYFVEAAGIGLFARAMPAAERSRTLASLTSAEAKVAYALQMLRDRLETCEPHRLHMRLDGREVSGEFVLFEAMNMEFVGPNLYLAPEVDPCDGTLDLVLVSSAERDKLHESLAHWQDGKRKRPDLPRTRVQRVELDWTGFHVHFDDEAWPGEQQDKPAPGPIELSVEREAVVFVAPAQALAASTIALTCPIRTSDTRSS
jgi:diacylglycerol kinase family enzyme